MTLKRKRPPRIGVALGGGGARGYAHLPVLKVLDDMGLRPHHLSGTSIGGLVGALYASGRPAETIMRGILDATIESDDSLRDILKKKDLLKWLNLAYPELGRGGIVRSDRIIATLLREIEVSTFEELAIPLDVLTTDIWKVEDVVFNSGPLLPALRATMAVPGVFAPVQHEGRLLVDGGLMNLVPYDHLGGDCDIVVAVNITGTIDCETKKPPHTAELLRRTIDIMQVAQFRRQTRERPPDIIVEPDVGHVSMLQFDKAEKVFARAQPAADAFRKQLEARLGSRG